MELTVVQRSYKRSLHLKEAYVYNYVELRLTTSNDVLLRLTKVNYGHTNYGQLRSCP